MKSFIQQDDHIANVIECIESKKKCEVGRHRFEYEPFDDTNTTTSTTNNSNNNNNNNNNNSHQQLFQLTRFQHSVKNLGIKFKK